MRMGQGHGVRPAYNVQTAVDAEHALIVAQQVTTQPLDNRSLLPMAEAALQAVGSPSQLNVVTDAGYSNGAQVEACETRGIVAHAPANRGLNHRGDGTLYDRRQFEYDGESDTFRCPAGETLRRKGLQKDRHRVLYTASAQACGRCVLKSRCTVSPQRYVYIHLHEAALERMNQRATPQVMRLRRSTVEHPFAALKYHIFGHPRLLLRGLAGAQTEIGLATMVYNLKRMIKVLGAPQLAATLAG